MISSLLAKTLLTLFYFQCTIGISPSDDQSELSIKDRLTASASENVIDEYVQYKTPQLHQENVYLYESFDDVHRFKKIWHKSQSNKGPNGEFNYDGTWDIVVTHKKIRGDYGLRMRSKSKHHAISRKLDQEFNFTGSPLIIQYDVQFRNGQECGGAYIKLLSAPSGNLSRINDQSRYSIMFGPDKCGSDHRLHFIFSHINSKTGEIREIHWKDAHTLTNLADVFIDGKWHLFRLSINPSNRFEISMDKRIVAIGSLLTDFSPSVNPDLEIDDPNDAKPEDWDEREKIPDPDAVKPDDWDNGEPKLIPDTKARKPKGWLENEALMIPDPNAVKPEDLSDDEKGSWSPPMIKNPRCASAPGCGPWNPPMIDNPKYKGEWMPPLIPNLAYQGKWVPRKIPNPDYFEDKHPYKSIAPIDAVTFELWTLSDGIVFDNILITSDIAIADSIAMATYQIKKEINDLETDNWFKRLIKQTNKKPWLWAVYIVALQFLLYFSLVFVVLLRVHHQKALHLQQTIHQPLYHQSLNCLTRPPVRHLQHWLTIYILIIC
ncbi:calnexin-like [Tetranychus urticae]|uniref:calnexin-like n=1 Tax=Tetranychus urticae TaxID=32264 RepID=UPI00077B9340|nr:calnexin-like [Tetranychus urticae]